MSQKDSLRSPWEEVIQVSLLFSRAPAIPADGLEFLCIRKGLSPGVQLPLNSGRKSRQFVIQTMEKWRRKRKGGMLLEIADILNIKERKKKNWIGEEVFDSLKIQK